MIGVAMAVVLLGATACGGPASPTPATGLTGVVRRGPITPVCQVDVPCDAPFSAGFTVEQGRTSVARFRSDAEGRFTVHVQPGAYIVLPDADAPLIAPQSQGKPVTVGPSGLTEVRLEFDTGIR